MVTVQADVPEGVRLARVEANVETLIRGMADVRAEMRDMRTYITVDQNAKELRGTVDQNAKGLRGAVDQNTKDLRAVLDRHFLWTLGILISMWVTIMVAIAVGLY